METDDQDRQARREALRAEYPIRAGVRDAWDTLQAARKLAVRTWGGESPRWMAVQPVWNNIDETFASLLAAVETEEHRLTLAEWDETAEDFREFIGPESRPHELHEQGG